MRDGKTFGMLLAVVAFLAPAVARAASGGCNTSNSGTFTTLEVPGQRSWLQLASTRRGTSLDATSPLV